MRSTVGVLVPLQGVHPVVAAEVEDGHPGLRQPMSRFPRRTMRQGQEHHVQTGQAGHVDGLQNPVGSGQVWMDLTEG